MRPARRQSLAGLRRLGQSRQWLVVRAALTLAASSAAVALLPFRTAIGYGSIRLKKRSDPALPDFVWAVEAAARRVPWRTMCIEKGLATQRLLRSAGVDAILHYGARNDPDGGKLEAHVWVSVSDEIVIGGAEARGFAEIATFP
jgi:hypothetical protein